MRPPGAWPVSSALTAEGLRLCAHPASALVRAGREVGALADPGPGQGSSEFCPPARDLGAAAALCPPGGWNGGLPAQEAAV